MSKFFTLVAFVCITSITLTNPAIAGTFLHSVSYEEIDGKATQIVNHQIHIASQLSEEEKEKRFEESYYPRQIIEHETFNDLDRIVVLRSTDIELIEDLLEQRGLTVTEPLARTPEGRRHQDKQKAIDDEVITIVDSGPPSNRINLVFMGDGYTQDERVKFIADIERLVDDMFGDVTFQSYLPVFNVYAVFRPSNESGLGRNGVPRNTAYRLYRDGNTLRAIFPGNRAAIRSSCRAAPGCDYPVVIANDPYYGGLGGEFAIATSSKTSGTIVLRHELGHNFGRVGEEYDGGGYFGANHASSLRAINWRHWASEPTIRAQPSAARFLSWPWHNLARSAYTIGFNSTGNMGSAKLRFSASGVPHGHRMEVRLNGQLINYDDPDTFDRTFQDIELDRFPRGRQTLEFRQLDSEEPDAWVSSVAIHEFGPNYEFDPDYIGAFPVFMQNLSVAGYRPNHETCLMRNMRSTVFCVVCQENNWNHFFTKIRLIDGVDVQRTQASVVASVGTPDLGEFRGIASEDRLLISWYQNNLEREDLANQRSWELPSTESSGSWRVEVRYQTTEIRVDRRNRLHDRMTFEI